MPESSVKGPGKLLGSRRMGRRRLSMISAIGAAVVIIALAAFAIRDVRGLIAEEQSVQRTNEVIQNLDDLLLAIDDAETGMRGYVITGRDEFLAPYRGADEKVRRLLGTLNTVISDNAAQKAPLDSLSEFVIRKGRSMHETIDARRSREFAEAAAIVANGNGKAMMDSIRAKVATMKRRETDILSAGIRAERKGLQRAELVGTLGIIIAALLAVLAWWLTTLTLRELERGRQSARYIRTLLDATSDGIYGLDKSGRITFANPAMCKALGYTPDEVIGRPAHPLFHHTRPDGTHYPARECPMARAIMANAGGTFDDEIIWRRDGTSLPVEYSISPIVERGESVGAVVSFRDITDRKLAERALRESKLAADRANVTKSDFLARMSHELRTPLNSVIGFANVLLRNKSGNLQPGDLNYLERIQKNGVRLLALINDILDLSKIEAGRMEIDPEQVDVGELAREVADEFETQVAARSLHLEVDVQGRFSPLTTDRLKLRQVLLNLVGNAIKFTEQGTVKIVVAGTGDGRVPTRIEVTDSGIGIPPDRIDAIFSAFEQAEKSTTRKYGGTGLGLPICRSLCELLGFTLTVKSAPGAGSTFIIGLVQHGDSRDIADAPVAPTAVERAAGTGAAVRGRTVLVIDDDPDARLLLKNLVTGLGARTIEAASGEEGLRLAREELPDVIALDLRMPGMSGWEVMRRLSADQSLRNIPVIIVSGEIRDGHIGLMGALTALPKPIDANALADALLREMGMGRVLIVDDDPDTRKLLTEYAYEEGAAEVRVAVDGAEALEIVDTFKPNLILLDIVMPRVNGFAVLAALEKHLLRDKISVIIVSSIELSKRETSSVRVPIIGVLRKGGNLEPEVRSMLRDYLSAARPRPAGNGS